jgi:hypothetical protein
MASGYPVERPHPNGMRIVTVYDVDQEKAVMGDFAKWREDHQRAEKAAKEGTDLSSTDLDLPAKRGPGRPRLSDNPIQEG